MPASRADMMQGHPIIHQYKSTTVLKRTSAIKVATMKITGDFYYEWKPSRAYHKIDTFCGEKR